jgi:hypothetical protein
MPNNRHWSASMLLEWVLTRDIDAVLSMASQYGGWQVDDQGAARIQPFTLDDVTRTHSIDESLPKEERAREAVRRADSFILPARQEIFDALRAGTLDGWARPNGSGDLTKIGPVQWAGLRFRGVDGHDIALPVDSEGDLLSLPRPLTDYLAGTVPVPFPPTVWPDPVFLAEQAMRLWPKGQTDSSKGTFAAAPYEADMETIAAPQQRRSIPAISDFDLRLGWIPVSDALQIIGGDAWPHVRKAIRREALRARCRADGITREFKPHWLDFLAYDAPANGTLWFDREKFWRARTRDASVEPVPDRASEIVLALAECLQLSPDRDWPEVGHPDDEFAGGVDPLGHRVHPFIIGDTHTIFEWCMIYTDRHPAAVNPDYNGATVRDMEFRLTVLGAADVGLKDAYRELIGPLNDAEEQIRNEVYRELVRDIERDRITPAKAAYCSDAPEMFDATRSVIGVEPILALARRRGDFGPAIAGLLAARPIQRNRERISRAIRPKRRPGPTATARGIQIAAQRLFTAGEIPGRTITWKRFHVAICKEIGVNTDQRGYSLDTIQAAVRPLLKQLPDKGSAENTEN